PSQIPRQDVLGTLEPLKANNCCCGRFRPPVVDATPGEVVDLLACHRGLDCFQATSLCNALPGVRHVSIKLIRIQAVNDTPRAPAKGYSLLALAGPQTTGSLADDLVNLIGADWGNRPYCTVTNAIPLFRDDVSN